ncbi:hypothetical protein [Pseudescherichia sp.]|uniref:hypothetical protein n=1 Tax=Pseudescherichia sp. TaxID=2055881 RepID=UPI0028ADFAED|nr:hypothetical protein [Pseudescherichia sp.]
MIKFKISWIRWAVTFFSTAFGAGVFYLPQSVGPGVASPNKFIIISLICAFISFCTHYQLYKFIQTSDQKMMLDAIEKSCGCKIAKIMCLLFLISMLSIALINFITIVNQLAPYINSSIISRFILSLTICLILCLSWLKFDRNIEVFTAKVSYFTIITICILAVFFSNFREDTFVSPNYTSSFVSMFPILLFVFNFSPCIQRFVQKSSIISSVKAMLCIGLGTVVILTFIIVFCFSLSHVLNTEDYLALHTNNLDSLSFASRKSGTSSAIIMSAAAILLASIGAYLGTLTGIVDSLISFRLEKKWLSVMSVLAISTLFATLNFSILKTISYISLPVITITIFFIPSIHFLRKKDNIALSLIVLLSGVAALLSVIA